MNIYIKNLNKILANRPQQQIKNELYTMSKWNSPQKFKVGSIYQNQLMACTTLIESRTKTTEEAQWVQNLSKFRTVP